VNQCVRHSGALLRSLPTHVAGRSQLGVAVVVHSTGFPAFHYLNTQL
jgi:hypothetical protein